MSQLRGRRLLAALPLSLCLPLSVCLPPVLLVGTAAPAGAQDLPAYLGHLRGSAASTRYVLVDPATGATAYTSPGTATDGAAGRSAGDGPELAWVSTERAGSSAVARLHVVSRGGGDTVVYSGAVGQDITEPSVSADGRTVAFALDDDASSALVTVDADGTGATVLTSRTDGDLEDAAWSPDGSRLATTVYRGGADDGNSSLAVVDVRTGALTTLATGSTAGTRITSYLEPTWSADGAWVLATRLVETATEDGALQSFGLDGSAGQPVPTTDYAGAPSVSAGPLTGDRTSPEPVRDLTAVVAGATAHLSSVLPAGDRSLADVVVTRDSSQTPTATTVLARSRSGALDVALPEPSRLYTFSAYARDWSGNLSSPATTTVRSPDPSVLDVAAPPSRVTFGQAVRLTGRLTQAGSGLAGQRVVLSARRAGTTTPVAVTSATTGADGTYTLAVTPAATAEYQVRWAGSATAYPSVSAERSSRSCRGCRWRRRPPGWRSGAS